MIYEIIELIIEKILSINQIRRSIISNYFKLLLIYQIFDLPVDELFIIRSHIYRLYLIFEKIIDNSRRIGFKLASVFLLVFSVQHFADHTATPKGMAQDPSAMQAFLAQRAQLQQVGHQEVQEMY